MLLNNLPHACMVTGFVPKHAHVALGVAERVNCIVLFREPGPMAAGLIEEGYGMKGFRIDTKSCNWGPMGGFVCMDPRLTKDQVYVEKNTKWTHEALSGEINKNFFGNDVTDPDWIGDVMPIVISKKRIDYLSNDAKEIKYIENNLGHKTGTSTDKKGKVSLSWRLIPVTNGQQPWLQGAKANDHVVCIDTEGPVAFRQQMPDPRGLTQPVKPIRFRGYEVLLGLANPGTKAKGYKACVTADYDLFAVWPGTMTSKNGPWELMEKQHFLSSIPSGSKLPGGVNRMIGVDSRLKASGYEEHHRYGDVSARTMNVKALLNSGIQNPVGNAVHHNDEAGNFALAKGTLKDCLPVIAFVPSVLPSKSQNRAAQPEMTVVLETLPEMKELVLYARANGFGPVLKDAWLGELGLQ